MESSYKELRRKFIESNDRCYAYDRNIILIHDRSCDLLKYIKDYDLRFKYDVDESDRLCRHCRRRIYVREMLQNSPRYVRACTNFFNSVKADERVLRKRFLDGAKLWFTDVDEAKLQYAEDTWCLGKRDDKILLYHNNYRLLPGYERVMCSGFHLQAERRWFDDVAEMIMSYSWQGHVEMFRKKELEEKQERMRMLLDETENFRKERDLRGILSVYTLCDFNGEGKTLARSKRIAAIRRKAKSGEGFILKCFVPLWKTRDFSIVAAILKESAIENCGEDYYDMCLALHDRVSEL